MKKVDLLKLIEGLGDEDNVLETLQGIEGLAKSSQLDVTKLTIEDYKNILENNQVIQGYWTSQKDSAVSKAVDKALKNYEEKKLPLKIEEAKKSWSNEGKTEEQIKYEEMEAKYKALEKQITMKELESKYKDTLSEKGLDTRLMKYILSENEEDIMSNINFFSEIISSTVDNTVKSRIGDNTYTPPKGDKGVTSMTKAELLNKDIVFISNFKADNPDEYTRIMNS